MIVVPGRPHGEFRHVKAPELDAAGGIQLAKNGRGVIRDKFSADFRAAAADFAGAIEHVLMRERYAVQRTKGMPCLDSLIGRASLCLGIGSGHADEAIERRLQSFDAAEAGFNQGLRPQSPLGNCSRGFAQRQRRNIVHRPASSRTSASSKR